jgi:hypothetical protein
MYDPGGFLKEFKLQAHPGVCGLRHAHVPPGLPCSTDRCVNGKPILGDGAILR